MQSAVFYGMGDVRLAESPLPQPAEGEARLRVLLAGMCATDRHIVAGHFSVRPPRILGHELVGVVDAVGPGVSAGWVGQMVGVRPARFCGECAMCRSGAPQLCLNFECLGNTHDGAYAEFTLARKDQLVPLEGIAPEAAVWLEPLACVLQALDRAQAARVDGPVLILGAGVLGKLMLEALLAMGSAPVAVVDPNPEKVAEALDLGAQAGWNIPRQGPAPEAEAGLQAWAPGGVALAIDTTGAPQAIRRAVEWAAPNGKVLLFGVSDPDAVLEISPHLIFGKELTLLASSGMSPASFDAAVALLRSGKLDPHGLVSRTIGLEDLPAQLLGLAPKEPGKVLVQPAGPEPAGPEPAGKEPGGQAEAR